MSLGGYISKGINPIVLALIAMGMMGDPYSHRHAPQEDELDMYLRINNITLAQEVEKIKQKKSGLSARLREVALYRFENQSKEQE